MEGARGSFMAEASDVLLRLLQVLLSDSSTVTDLLLLAYLPDKARLKTNTVDATDSKSVNQTPQFDQEISSCFFAYAAPVEVVPDDIKEWPTEKQWEWIKNDMGTYWCAK